MYTQNINENDNNYNTNNDNNDNHMVIINIISILKARSSRRGLILISFKQQQHKLTHSTCLDNDNLNNNEL